ncbi:MAG: c-type cytochrome biogenesis protein CcsB [Elusimicrobia bacterium]|nr:c-type cytochrome biogenesis protein CcsB [Elusimicrobiota bacterium]
MEFLLFNLSLFLYSAALLGSALYLWRRGDLLEKGWKAVLALGCLVHLASFAVRTASFWALYQENRYFLPINTFFGALSYLALTANLVCLVLAVRYRISVLGVFVLPFSLAAQISAAAGAEAGLAGLVPALQSYWINIHPLVIMTCYGILVNAFGVSLAYIVQDWQLRSRRPKEFVWQIPSLEVLDRLTYQMIFLMLPVLTIGIAMGGVWAWDAWGRFWGWDAKETWALITWLIYIVYLHLRLARGWRGRAAAYVNFVGFASVLFTFFGVNYLSKLHGYLSQ